jgi:drug/metabolite transporter (DMT)-like permease
MVVVRIDHCILLGCLRNSASQRTACDGRSAEWPLQSIFICWNFPARGLGWSLLAGTAGAVGAFCVLLAFGAKGTPAVVMSIVFAGAPIVNAIVALILHPPTGGWGEMRWQFIAGILLAAAGGFLVTLYKPK